MLAYPSTREILKMDKVIRDWYCPNCKLTHRSENSKVSEVPMHDCPALFGLKVPMVLEGVKAFHTIEYREDYLHNDLASARNDSGQVIKSISTEYEDGSNGGTIYLPCATFNMTKD